ncbi:MAG TPA: hypothetical protein VGK48_23830 [Terriglobia bacterium]
MHVSSRLTIRQVLAVAVFLTLAGAGSPRLQAQSCPETLREKPTAPQAESCCPVDPKDVKKAQKEADHEGHEAAMACKKQQQAAMKAQHKIDKAYAKGNHKVEAANAKLEKEKGESAEANAKLESLQGSNEQAAAITPKADDNESIMRSKPQPEPAPMAPSMPAPATPQPSINSETPSTPEAAPVPAPVPAPEPKASQPMSQETKPTELPRTASGLELLGLVGLASSISGYVARRFRS